MILSIITITRDDPTGLSRTLDSSKAWRGRNDVEQIVVDGGGGGHAQQALPPVRHLARSPQGIGDAFNAGSASAQGQWLWFLNGGDAIHEDLAPEWLLPLLVHTQGDVVIGGIHYDGAGGASATCPIGRQWPLTACWIPHPATLIRKRLIDAAGGFDCRWRIAMDFDLWHRVIRPDTIVDCISRPFVRFDVNGLSQRPDTRAAVQAEGARILLRYAPRLIRLAASPLVRVGTALWRATLNGFRSEGKERLP